MRVSVSSVWPVSASRHAGLDPASSLSRCCGRSFKRLLHIAFASIVFAFASAAAQPYPMKPIRFIVPSAPGGSSDFIARTFAQKITESLRQQVIVDNRAGGTGLIGVQVASKAAADGYTVLIASSSAFATTPALTPKLAYDPIKDFSPVTLIVVSPNMLTAHPSVPAQTLSELIQLAKAKPGQITFASPGVGSLSHMAGELLMRAAGIKMLHVPYKGGGLAVSDLVGGQVQLLFGSVSTSVPLVRAGKLRALAVTTTKRVIAVPDVPTIAESGYPGYEAVQWFGLVVPAGTPRPIIDKLRNEVARIVVLEDVKAALTRQGFDGVGGTSEEFGDYIKAELAKWSKLFKEIGLQAEQIR
jgi:tripartite-type tricarboxylate transporter receptor subunit TctC